MYSLKNGIALYKYNYKGWNEKLDSANIGLVDKSNLILIDTLITIRENEKISVDVGAYID